MAVTLDDFLISSTSPALIDNFYNKLCPKYKSKLLAKPTRLLVWTLSYGEDEIITITQPTSVHARTTDSSMRHGGGRLAPYNHI